MKKLAYESQVREISTTACSMPPPALSLQGDEGFAHGSSYLTPIRQTLANTRIKDSTKKRKLHEI